MRIDKTEATARNEHGQRILSHLFNTGWKVMSTGSVLTVVKGNEKRDYTFKRGYLMRCV